MKADFHKRLVALKTADAISAIKGVPVSADAKLLSEKWVRGKLTGEQMKQELLDLHGRLRQRRIGAIIEFKRLWGMKSVTAADLWRKQN